MNAQEVAALLRAGFSSEQVSEIERAAGPGRWLLLQRLVSARWMSLMPFATIMIVMQGFNLGMPTWACWALWIAALGPFVVLAFWRLILNGLHPEGRIYRRIQALSTLASLPEHERAGWARFQLQNIACTAYGVRTAVEFEQQMATEYQSSQTRRWVFGAGLGVMTITIAFFTIGLPLMLGLG